MIDKIKEFLIFVWNAVMVVISGILFLVFSYVSCVVEIMVLLFILYVVSWLWGVIF